tara:strand:+ start:64 stop:519 length:456 start_codon:yes stop_codon:yes gene_type:complete
VIKDLKAQMEYFEAKSECFKKAYDKHISACALLNKQMIQNSIDNSTDINDNSSFEPLKTVTKDSRLRRGNPAEPALKETGNLYRGIIKRKNLVINTVAYGEFHNDGDGVPQRRYFDTPDDFFDTPEYQVLKQELDNELKKCMRSSKKTIKI